MIGIFASLKVALLNLITISSTWARVIDVMDSEVCFLHMSLITSIDFGTCMTCVVFSQVQDCLGSLVLVPHLASYLDHYLPQEWHGWGHVCFLVPLLGNCKLFSCWCSFFLVGF